MPSLPGLDADVYFGDPEKPLPAVVPETTDGDDAPTADELKAVAGVLGFDPRELEAAPARLSLADAPDSASRLVDAVIARGAAAGVTISDEVRRQVRRLVKKKYPDSP